MKANQTEAFRELLKDFDTAVLITHGKETHFHARPMAIAHVDDNCDLWFITSEESLKTHEIKVDARVQVVCQNGSTSCVSIAGHATLIRDRSRIHDMWKPAFRAWFPLGEDDPNIVLIHVAGKLGEYWDNRGMNALVYAYNAVAAVMTGTTPEVEEGEQHGKLKLAHR